MAEKKWYGMPAKGGAAVRAASFTAAVVDKFSKSKKKR